LVARKGFTLVELLIVTSMLGVVSATLMTIWAGADRQSKEILASQNAHQAIRLLTRRISVEYRNAENIGLPIGEWTDSETVLTLSRVPAKSGETRDVVYFEHDERLWKREFDTQGQEKASHPTTPEGVTIGFERPEPDLLRVNIKWENPKDRREVAHKRAFLVARRTRRTDEERGQP